MKEHSLFYRWFRRDIGRKITALFLALLLYGAIDQQIRTSDVLYVSIQYVDEHESEAFQETEWMLKVVQRWSSDSPLIAPMDRRVPQIKLRVSGSKTAIEGLQSQPINLKYFPASEGVVPLALDDIEGIDEIRSRLGPEGVELVDEVNFTFAMEETADLELRPHHIETRGEPLDGWEYPQDALEQNILFRPAHVELVGPGSLLDEIVSEGRPIFRLDVDGKSGTVELSLDLLEDVDADLSQRRAFRPVEVTIRFQESLVPLGEQGLFEKEIHLLADRASLDLADSDRMDSGEQLQFVDPADRMRRLQIQVPRNLLDTEGSDGTRRSLAKDQTQLFAFAHELSAERGTVQVYIRTFDDFPDRWQVRFADPLDQEPDRVEIYWESPEEDSSE